MIRDNSSKGPLLGGALEQRPNGQQPAAQSTNPFLGKDNPYLTQRIDQAQGDLARNFNLTTQPAYNAAMVRSGSFGNSGVQQLNENAQRNLQSEMGDISTNMRGADYRDQQGIYERDQQFNEGVRRNDRDFGQSAYQFDQQFDRTLFNDAFGQNQQNLQNATGLLGQLNGYNQNDIGNATSMQNAPLNYYGQFSNSANSIGQGYGNSSTSGGGSNPFVSALGAAQIGQGLANAWGSSGGGGGSGNGNGGWSSGGQTYNNPSQYGGGSQPYIPDTNNYNPTW